MAERLKAELTGPYTKRCKGPDILAAQGATHAGQRKANLKSGLIIPRVKQGIGSEIMHTETKIGHASLGGRLGYLEWFQVFVMWISG